jgi:hypothetical protein
MSTAVNQRVAQVSSVNVTSLQGMERLQTALGEDRFVDVIVGELVGMVAYGALRRAAGQLASRHPALSRRVRIDPALGPVAEAVSVGAPDLRVSIAHWQDAVEALLDEPFEDGPSWRILVVQGAGSHHVALAVHHALVDGRSLSVLLDELVALVAGEALPPPAPPAVSAVTRAPAWTRWLAPVARWVHAARTRWVQRSTPFAGPSVVPGASPGTRFSARTITAEAMSALRARAKRHDATVGGALAAAAADTTRAIAGDGSVEMMVDLRSTVDGGAGVGMYASGVLALRSGARGPRWRRAASATRAVHRQVAWGVPFVPVVAFDVPDPFSALRALGVDPYLSGGAGAVTQVSNVGVWPYATRRGSVRLRRVWSATSAILTGPAVLVWVRTVDGVGCVSAIGNRSVVSADRLERWLDVFVATLTEMARS